MVDFFRLLARRQEGEIIIWHLGKELKVRSPNSQELSLLNGPGVKAVVVVSFFDEDALEKMRACKKAEFPICLRESLIRMFGENGKKRLDSIITNETFESEPITSTKDIWKLYERYIERISNVMGVDVGKVIEFESVREMESMFCTKCPLFEKHLNSLENPEDHPPDTQKLL